MNVVIIQARMGSSRLPGKVLQDLAGHPMLWYVVQRVDQAKTVDQILVATTVHPSDDSVVEWCQVENIAYFRGSEDDVLDRYYQAATFMEALLIVRITADCPLIDPEIIDKVVLAYQEAGVDYACNTQPPTYPDGLDTEVFSFEALERAWKEAALPSEREHVTPYIWKNPAKFKLLNVTHDQDLSDFRWTVDEPTDLEFVRAIYQTMGTPFFGMQDVLDLLQKYPEISQINNNISRNEGYAISIQKE